MNELACDLLRNLRYIRNILILSYIVISHLQGERSDIATILFTEECFDGPLICVAT